MPADLPMRVQLRRTRGWRMPENTVKVTRPGLFGNPFSVHPHHRPGRAWNSGTGSATFSVPTVEDAVECFREMLTVEGPRADAIRAAIPKLTGRNLACWCRLCPAHRNGKPLGVECAACAPCHADVLLEMASRPRCDALPPAREAGRSSSGSGGGASSTTSGTTEDYAHG